MVDECRPKMAGNGEAWRWAGIQSTFRRNLSRLKN